MQMSIRPAMLQASMCEVAATIIERRPFAGRSRQHPPDVVVEGSMRGDLAETESDRFVQRVRGTF